MTRVATDETKAKAAMQREIASLYGESVPARAWRVDIWEGFVRLLTVGLFVGADAWYAFHKLVPGPIMYALLTWYLTPPVYRAIRQARIEQLAHARDQIHLEQLQVRLSQLPQSALLTRVAAVAQRMGTTGVMAQLETLCVESGDAFESSTVSGAGMWVDESDSRESARKAVI